MRGKVLFGGIINVSFGITPAHAGKRLKDPRNIGVFSTAAFIFHPLFVTYFNGTVFPIELSMLQIQKGHSVLNPW